GPGQSRGSHARRVEEWRGRSEHQPLEGLGAHSIDRRSADARRLVALGVPARIAGAHGCTAVTVKTPGRTCTVCWDSSVPFSVAPTVTSPRGGWNTIAAPVVSVFVVSAPGVSSLKYQRTPGGST